MYIDTVPRTDKWFSRRTIREEQSPFFFSAFEINEDWDELTEAEALPLREPALLSEHGGWNHHGD